MTIRCKFTCQSVTKRKAWQSSSVPYVHEAEFTAVYDGSEENKAFFEATPSGSLKIGTYKKDVFEPGTDYYIDITPVDGKGA